uniref:SLOG family protein n=1 Tax=Staphylococcus aureus TaxID=1280 RepID=UPI00210DD8C6
IIKYADYVDSMFHTSYQGPFQFKQADQCMLEHSYQTLFIYDEEQDASPKFFKQKLVDFMYKTNYTCDIVTFDELTASIKDLQWSEDQSF